MCILAIEAPVADMAITPDSLTITVASVNGSVYFCWVNHFPLNSNHIVKNELTYVVSFWLLKINTKAEKKSHYTWIPHGGKPLSRIIFVETDSTTKLISFLIFYLLL
jgi:hypothetical protein